jgi:membrane protein YdbS with pleckstrin-like domain
MVLRPSLKFIKLAYVLTLLLAVAIAVYLEATGNQDINLWYTMAIPGVLLILTMIRHVERRLVKLTISGDRLRYESGLMAKTTRTMELSKVQDVRVDQTFGQRMAGIGDLSFETAGSGSRIVVKSIDNPQPAADHILELAASLRNSPPSQPAGQPPHA